MNPLDTTMDTSVLNLSVLNSTIGGAPKKTGGIPIPLTMQPSTSGSTVSLIILSSVLIFLFRKILLTKSVLTLLVNTVTFYVTNETAINWSTLKLVTPGIHSRQMPVYGPIIPTKYTEPPRKTHW